ncbi:MAG: ATP phosphoribosyltransferase regulatory subunit [Beijerinckiaceae bacterium]|nr:ATP phosphoribosyltransferase regulatory subunit [Beijerinckiaceae bacterium]MCI0737066.1 ATP phosphoribosyltransferase regulatory subunit [Beijerinckiaceae bacterium]
MARLLSLADQRATCIIAHLTGAGYARREPPILQPASIFFDSGEDLRAQLYLTSDLSGADYCLRPEYTIPVLAAYLATEDAGKRAEFSYCGPVFRFRPGAPSEFTQAGIESFGRAGHEAADAEILALALAAAAAARQAAASPLALRIGDAGLFSRLLEALDLSPQWRRRIARGHGQGKSLDTILSPRNNGAASDHSGVLAILEGADKQGARALVEDLLSIAGVAPAGGRTPGEIADRFLEQAALRTSAGICSRKRAVIERFLDIEGSPGSASKRLRALAAEAGLDLSAQLDSFDIRLEHIAGHGLDIAKVHFAARFTRNLDYYTGFVFEAHETGATEPVLGGGRYDQLPQALGAKAPIPAVGAAIWVDRLRIEGARP